MNPQLVRPGLVCAWGAGGGTRGEAAAGGRVQHRRGVHFQAAGLTDGLRCLTAGLLCSVLIWLGLPLTHSPLLSTQSTDQQKTGQLTDLLTAAMTADYRLHFLSLLKRAIRSSWIILREMNTVYLPVYKVCF